jgi:uncharacterized protein YbgA (DUF1722 family)/uncharacterized protein YbbK (DUF523 family)
MQQAKLKIGISACVVGKQVRYDGSHKRSAFCSEQLAEFAEFVPVCPEMAVGLPVPRPTIRQIRGADQVIKLSRPDGSGDVTQAIKEFGQRVAVDMDDLAGFIFCAKSPTCGMERVKVYHHHGKGSESNGVGLFAQQIIKANPSLPVEENGRLNDPILRENFITRIFVYHKWQALTKQGLTKHKLIDFHRAHKYLLMSHHIDSYRRLGRLVAQSPLGISPLGEHYIAGLMAALTHKATRGSHANTLQHLQGYFKKQLTPEKRQELSEEIDAFRQGVSPLLVPLTLINHYLREFPNDYLQEQVYLNPHPKVLRLRYGY